MHLWWVGHALVAICAILKATFVAFSVIFWFTRGVVHHAAATFSTHTGVAMCWALVEARVLRYGRWWGLSVWTSHWVSSITGLSLGGWLWLTFIHWSFAGTILVSITLGGRGSWWHWFLGSWFGMALHAITTFLLTIIRAHGLWRATLFSTVPAVTVAVHVTPSFVAILPAWVVFLSLFDMAFLAATALFTTLIWAFNTLWAFWWV